MEGFKQFMENEPFGVTMQSPKRITSPSPAPQPVAQNSGVDEQTMQAVQGYLGKLEGSGFRLLAHQTSDDVALNIMRSQDFGHMGVEGTALFTNSARIAQTIRTMNLAHAAKARGDYAGYDMHALSNIHKGSNAVLIMAIPKQIAPRGEREFDGHLADLVQAGKIEGLGVPNQYIVGYWGHDGKFNANGKFKPTGLL